MKKIVVYVHGKGGSAAEAEHYRSLFPEADVVGFNYRAQTPWEAKSEFPPFFAELRARCDTLVLVANSIGAFFAMSALDETQVDRACLISPVVDMETLIGDMMCWANVTPQELEAKGEIPTDFGETLSWDYLRYVREHPLSWRVPTRILYGARDNLTSLETISAFAACIGAELTVMAEGEHWFHTEEQIRVLDDWMRRKPRYIALLRGVNISGKNSVPMAELKLGLEELGFAEVKTWLNSGNVCFSTGEAGAAALAAQIGQMIRRRFGLTIPVLVLSKQTLADILRHAPAWWGTEDRAIYDNLIFPLPPATAAELCREIGAPREGLEQIQVYRDAVFWSFSRKDYQKTNWWARTAAADTGKKLTIRTANTLRKIAEL